MAWLFELIAVVGTGFSVAVTIIFGSLVFRVWRMALPRPTLMNFINFKMEEVRVEPLVTVIIPAHNEQEIIAECARSLARQSYSNMEVVFVLDRCTDETKKVLLRETRNDSRFVIIENDNCPQGWAGKCYAAKVGVQEANGDYLLFMDADTRSHVELVSSALSAIAFYKVGLISLLSTLDYSDVFEKKLQPIASAMLMRMYPIDRINSSNPRSFANGQFLLFSREAYKGIGGHGAVRDDLLEDLAFARAIKYRGYGCKTLFADKLLCCKMYDSKESFKSGWVRIFIEASRRRPRKLRQSANLIAWIGIWAPFISLCMLFLGMNELSGFETVDELERPLPAGGLFLFSFLALFFYGILFFTLWRVQRAPLKSLWSVPIGCWEVRNIFLEAAKVLEKKLPIEWGGRSYTLEPRE